MPIHSKPRLKIPASLLPKPELGGRLIASREEAGAADSGHLRGKLSGAAERPVDAHVPVGRLGGALIEAAHRQRQEERTRQLTAWRAVFAEAGRYRVVPTEVEDGVRLIAKPRSSHGPEGVPTEVDVTDLFLPDPTNPDEPTYLTRNPHGDNPQTWRINQLVPPLKDGAEYRLGVTRVSDDRRGSVAIDRIGGGVPDAAGNTWAPVIPAE